MSDKELKPCPFCGTNANKRSYDRLISIGCKKCGYSIGYKGLLQTEPDYKNKQGGINPVNPDNEIKEYYHMHANSAAVKAWNTRQPDPRIKEALEVLIENYRYIGQFKKDSMLDVRKFLSIIEQVASILQREEA